MSDLLKTADERIAENTGEGVYDDTVLEYRCAEYAALWRVVKAAQIVSDSIGTTWDGTVMGDDELADALYALTEAIT